MEHLSMEGSDPLQEKLQKKFEYYKNDFPLTEDELRGSLLDVGAGTGEFVQYLREVLHNTDAKGVEYQGAKISPEKKEWLIQADGLNLPFEDDSFETVTAHNYLRMFVEDAGEMEKAIYELLRVVKPNGRVMGDISTLEDEIFSEKELRENLGDDYDEKVAKHSQQRIDGSIKLAAFLEMLSKEHNLEIVGPRRDVLIITK